MMYTGTHYQSVSEETVRSYAREALQARCHYAVNRQIDKLITATKPSAYNIHACTQIYKDMVNTDDTEQFDKDPDLLNCLNGVLNLRTGSVTPHLPCQLLTYCLPVSYNTDADMSEWVNFVHSALV